MAHQQQRDFCLAVKSKFPEYFKGTWALDIGSLDINGNNQYLFDESGYIGIDLLPGKNVDFASKGHELQFPDSSFDAIVSTECFEHDPHHEETIKNIVRMLKPGGMFLFSCATTGRPEHGTRRTTPHDAPFTHEFDQWGDYYKNLEEQDIRKFLDVDSIFSEYEFSVQHETHDLYFWGIKKGTYSKRLDYSFQLADSPYQMLLAELSQHEQLVSSLKKQLEQSEYDIKKCRAELLQTLDHLKETSKNLLHQETKCRALEADLSQKTMLLTNILQSKSWKITRPLRALMEITRSRK